MSTIFPLTLKRHGGRAWNSAAGFSWAQQELLAPIARKEALRLMMGMPLGFLRHENETQLCVLLGLREGENLMVGPDGRWLAPAVPAVFQHYPFRRLVDSEGNSLLGIDEDGLLPLNASEGTALFDTNGKPAPQLNTILEQLIKNDIERKQTSQVVSKLEDCELLEPWELKVHDDEGQHSVNGLFRINEKNLNALPAEALLTLRNTGALLLAYSQLLSMQHIQQLGRMATNLATKRRLAQALLTSGDTISFSNL